MDADARKMFEQGLAAQQSEALRAANDSERERLRLGQERLRIEQELKVLVSILRDRRVPTAPLYQRTSSKNPFWSPPSLRVNKYKRIDGRAWMLASWSTGEDYTSTHHTAVITTTGSILSAEVIRNSADYNARGETTFVEDQVPGEPGFAVYGTLRSQDVPLALGRTPEETAGQYLQTVNSNTSGDETYWDRGGLFLLEKKRSKRK